MTDEKLTITIKESSEPDAVWYVVHAGSPAEAVDILGALTALGLPALVAQAKVTIRAVNTLGEAFTLAPVQHADVAQQQYQQQGGYQQQPPAQQHQQGYPQQQGYQQAPQQGYQGQPQQQPQQAPPQNGPPPGMAAPQCPHGIKKYINGKYGPFWGCPAPMNAPDKCKIEKIY